MQPEQLGPFRIQRVLGRGGMGAVYEGVNVETGEVAAVKVLLSVLEEDEELRLRFEAEIDTLKRLRHPNIVRLFGFGEEQGMLYYVMEMVDGPSLHQEMKKRRAFEWSVAAKIGLEMCSALKHAHDRGITHRDIKPANILLEKKGVSKLSDYGIAQLFGGDRLTGINSVVGTLEYMAPEQALASPVGPRSDLYSLGAVLYAILAGKPPFSAKTLAEIIRKQQNNTPEPIRATRLDVPDELESIIFDLLKIKPEERPSNAYMAGKRFQSLLQALVGPPERILVLPMNDDEAALPPSRPITAFPRDTQNQIGRPRGMVIEGGIIDLGGIVRSDEQTEISAKEQEADAVLETRISDLPDRQESAEELLEKSFGRPGDLVDFTAKDSESPDDSIAEHAEFLKQEYKRRGLPTPDEVAERNRPAVPKSVHDLEEDEDASPSLPHSLIEADENRSKGSQATSATKVSSQPIYGSSIRQGEIIVENLTGFRHAKDDPIPITNRFDDVLKESFVSPMEALDNYQLPPSDAERDKATEWTQRKAQDSPQPSPGREINPDSSSDISPPFLNGPPPHLEKRHAHEQSSQSGNNRGPVYSIESEERNSTQSLASDKPTQTISRFVPVKEEDLGEYKEEQNLGGWGMSLQTVLASISLVLVGLLFYYSLQPVPADKLYHRITETLEEDDSGEYSLSSLRQAKRDIDDFLATYSQHPKAETVREYKEELELANKEQKLKQRQAFTDPTSRAPAEWAYMEAVSLSRTDMEKEIVKLKAIVDLYASENPGKPDEKTTRKYLANETEMCVELARRRLKKMEPLFERIKDNQRTNIETRLETADRLQGTDANRATQIRRGVIELYQDRPWAADLVERARKSIRE